MKSPIPSTKDILLFLTISFLFLSFLAAMIFSTHNPTQPTPPTTPITTHLTPPLFARIITTNLVSVPCPCGFCKPDQGIAVPEHINQIGYDLKVVVSTSYFPVVSLPTH